jgi:hypothetical protein
MILGLIGLGVLFTLLLNLLTLAAVGRLVIEQRDRFDAFLGQAELGIRSYAELDDKIQNALSCLISVDAALDIVKTSESGCRAL